MPGPGLAGGPAASRRSAGRSPASCCSPPRPWSTPPASSAAATWSCSPASRGAAAGDRARRPRRPPAPAARREGPVRHVAYIGQVQPHKGALVFEEVVRRLPPETRPELHWSAYGGGDAELLRRLRRLPRVRVRGYYRSGSLVDRLRRDRVDLALLLSIVPGVLQPGALGMPGGGGAGHRLRSRRDRRAGPPARRRPAGRSGGRGGGDRGPRGRAGRGQRRPASRPGLRPAGAPRTPPEAFQRALPGAGLELRSGRRRRNRTAEEPFLLHLVAGEDAEHGEAVADAAAEADLRGLGEVAGLDRDLADAQPCEDPLGDDLGVEDEVVRVASRSTVSR